VSDLQQFLSQHEELTRRYFLRLAAAGTAGMGLAGRTAADEPARPTELAEALAKLEPYFTLPEKFQDVSRGNPLPHSLDDEKKRQAGLTRESWRLEILSDTEHPVKLRRPLTKEAGTALDFEALMRLADRKSVRFAKLMTCLNIGCPLGMGVWEGVPLRELVWLTQPGDNVRRVFYYGYHNDKPEQMFRSRR